MNVNKTKRERSENFSITERDILVSLVQKYRNILENKQSGFSTWKKKEAAWENIQKEFNARSTGTYRSSKTLKIKYEGLKRSVRKKTAARRSELYRGTRGGSNEVPTLDPAEEHIKSMISLNTDDLDSVYDQDDSNSKKDVFIEIPTTLPINIKAEVIDRETNNVNEVEQEESQNVIIKSESDTLPSTSAETFAEDNNIPLQNNENDMALHDTPSDTAPTVNRKWDLTSRRKLKSMRHPALMANLPKKPIDDLTRVKIELIQLQKTILESEIIEKKKEWEYNELKRLRETEFEEKEHKWKEEEYKLKNIQALQELQFKEQENVRKEQEHKWKEEEHKLRLEKLRKELNEQL